MCEHECYIEVSTRNFVYVLNDNTDEISLWKMLCYEKMKIT